MTIGTDARDRFGTAETRTHNRQNQLTSGGLAYDANGNTTTDDAGRTLVYDAWNRLVSVTPSGGSAKTYAYDALGRRVTETPAGGTTRMLYYSEQWQVLEEREGSAARSLDEWTRRY